MRLYPRYLANSIRKDFFKGKIIFLVGARQTGKTTLANMLLKFYSPSDTKFINGEDPLDRELLENRGYDHLRQIVGSAKILFVDEGQKISNIGQSLKLLVDGMGDALQILVTGSSSLNLLDQVSEPLTGRKTIYEIYPLSMFEVASNDPIKWRQVRDNFLVYGSYPEIVRQNSFARKEKLLRELASSYLYKDILEFQDIRNPELLRKLLKALSLQIGNEVSYHELANLLGIERTTVERYIDLLEKSYIIFRLPPLTTNRRREINRLRKIFFYDLGIRNAVINNFNQPDSRNDIGALWENLMIIERMKYRQQKNYFANQYFWRTYDGNEIDLVEEAKGQLHGFEFKWSDKTKKKPVPGFDSLKFVNPNNYIEFLN